MSSKKRPQIPGIMFGNLDEESAEQDEDQELDSRELEEALLEMDRVVRMLPPGASTANGVTINREVVLSQLQHYLRLHEDVRKARQEYDDALVRVALASGKWGQA